MDTEKFKIVSHEVCMAREGVVTVSSSDIRSLKERARASKLKRSRICVHTDNDNLVHEMIIAMTKDTRITPHKHINKEESFHILEGKLTIVLFDENGLITERIDLGEYQSGQKFFYRLPKNLFHTVIVHSDIAVIHEVTNLIHLLKDRQSLRTSIISNLNLFKISLQ